MKNLLVPGVIATVLLVIMLVGCKATRSGYESAPYKVVRSEGKFELRDYPALMVVETTMSGGADSGFNRLFKFITGSNETQQKIAMTTPVFMSGGESNTTMAFVLPARLKAGDVPQPKDASVQVRELPAGRFAVLRFKGGRNARNEATTLQRLKDWMSAENLEVLSGPVYDYFDPPWTPTFLRRNEVMLRTGPAPRP